jgi:four helix bundle protein
MEKIRRFEDLEIFQIARGLCKDIYIITDAESFKCDYRFTQQIRAAAGSIMDNIAEGFERNGNKEFVNFLYIAKGSCGEVRSQLLRANDVGYIDDVTFRQLYDRTLELGRKIYNLAQKIKDTGNPGSKYQ